MCNPFSCNYTKFIDIIGRVINVSSITHEKAIINSDNGYKGQIAYGESKLAQIMHATYLQTQIFTKYNLPLIAVSLHPGGVNTELSDLRVI